MRLSVFRGVKVGGSAFMPEFLSQTQTGKEMVLERKKKRVCDVCLCVCVCDVWGGGGRTGIMSDSRHPATSDFD